MNVTTAVSLAGRTTLRVGGPATEFVEAGSSEEAIDAVADADARGIPVLILGGGSNVLIGDAGFDGRVVAIASAGVREEADMCSGAMVTVAAGENWDALVARAVTNGWTGIEALSGIPGLVGGTADPERRRLRPGRLGHDRAGSHLRPGDDESPHVLRGRLWIRLPGFAIQGRAWSLPDPRGHLSVRAR